MKLPREAVLAFRLTRHHLVQRLPAGSAQRAAGVIGFQDTPRGSAALALAARVDGVTLFELADALESGTLVNVWAMRGAPHMVPSADVALFTRGLLPDTEEDLRAFLPGVVEALEATGISASDLVQRTAAGLHNVLGDRVLDKDQVGQQISRHLTATWKPAKSSAWKAPSWYAPRQTLGESMVRFALPVTSLMGLIRLVPLRSGKTGLRRSEPAELRDARAELLRRYLRCNGPSSAGMFAAWAGIGLRQAQATWSLLDRELSDVLVEGAPVHLLSSDMLGVRAARLPQGVQVLPPHDPYLTVRDRALLLPDVRRHRVMWRTAGNPGGLLVDGQLAGAWRARKQGSTLHITVEAWAALPRGDVCGALQALGPLRGCQSVVVTFPSSPARS